jgi:Tfp pilus assembly protein PilN
MGDVNLIPVRRLTRKCWKRRGRLWMHICGLYLLLLAGGFLSVRVLWPSDSHLLDRERQTVKSVVEEHRRRIAGLIAGQPDWSKLLVLLGHELGENVVLSQCRLSTTNAAAGEITEDLKGWLASSPLEELLASRQYRLKLSGFGRTQSSVSQFVLGLERTQVFESVRLINSYRQAFLEGQAIAFSIECRI